VDVLRAFAAEIVKMFAADLWLTLGAVAVVAVVAGGETAHVLGRGAVAPAIGVGVAAVLTVAVLRAARRR
jgi:hypothetical protein